MSIGPSGPIVTLTGNDSIAVAPDGAGNINVLGATDSFVNVFNSAANTLTIELLNQLVGTVTTNDDTPTTVSAITITTSTSQARFLSYQILAAEDDYSQIYTGNFGIGVQRQLGAPFLQSASFNNFNQGFLGNPDVQVIINGNDVEFQVIGVAGTTINWKVILTEITV